MHKRILKKCLKFGSNYEYRGGQVPDGPQVQIHRRHLTPTTDIVYTHFVNSGIKSAYLVYFDKDTNKAHLAQFFNADTINPKLFGMD